MRIDTSRNVGIGLTPSGVGFLEIKAGTASAVPLELTAGTNRTTAVAGGVEYDGRVFYATPQGTERGVIPGEQFFRLNAARVGANATGAQSVLGVGVTLSANTVYALELAYTLNKTAGTTSHAIFTLFGGTATFNNVYFNSTYNAAQNTISPPSGSAASIGTFNITGSVSLTSPTTSAINTFTMRQTGTISVNAGGTFIPQYSLSAAPGGAYSTLAGSFMRIYPIGAAGANTSVGTWA